METIAYLHIHHIPNNINIHFKSCYLTHDEANSPFCSARGFYQNWNEIFVFWLPNAPSCSPARY